MALVECPECGRKISSTATMCPNCGFRELQLALKMRADFERAPVVGARGQWVALLIWIAFVALIGRWLGFF